MKYKFTGKTKKHFGSTLNQIVCVTAFASIAAGDIGGWIEKDKNLDQSGNAWVSDNAQVYGNAQVSGDARVSGNAWVSGDAQVYGNAWVYGNAQVSGDARVSGNAWVYGNAQVSDNARVYGNAQVYGDARVSGNAWVSGDAQVYGNAWVYGRSRATKKVLTINSNRYHVTITDKHIAIGCQQHTIKQWAKMSRKKIVAMDGEEAADLWEKSKDFILMLADR